VRIERGQVLPGGDAQREELEQKERDERALLEALEGRLAAASSTCASPVAWPRAPPCSSTTKAASDRSSPR
jgi:hypothetical protein